MILSRATSLMSVLMLFAIGACGADRAPANTGSSISFTKAGGVVELSLSPLATITFDSANVSAPSEYRKLVIADDGLYALDNFDPFIKVYERSGAFSHQIGRPGQGPGELEMPLSFAVNGEEVWVVDLGRGRGVSRFTTEGVYVGQAAISPGSPIFDLGFVGGRPTVAVLGSEAENGGWDFVRVFDQAGEEQLRGCMRDASVISSLRVEGRLSMTPMTRFAAGEDVVYCIQQTSPVVQVLSLSGQKLNPFQLAPPFYRPPTEGELSLNAKSMFEYMATWTSHDAIYALADGFASVYSTYDLAAAEPRYAIFACRSLSAAPVCGAVEDLPQPAFIAPDGTVYLDHGEQDDAGRTSLGVYRLEGLGTA